MANSTRLELSQLLARARVSAHLQTAEAVVCLVDALEIALFQKSPVNPPPVIMRNQTWANQAASEAYAWMLQQSVTESSTAVQKLEQIIVGCYDRAWAEKGGA